MATRSDLEDVFGRKNIEAWADLDNDDDPVEISGRITWALGLGSDMVQAKVRVSTYDWDDMSSDSIVQHMIVVEAGLLLYANRSSSDEKQATSPMRRHEMRLKDLYKQLVAGRLALSSARSSRPFPAVIDDEDGDISTDS